MYDNHLKLYFTSRLGNIEHEEQEFIEQFRKDSLYALRWADTLVRKAALKATIKEVLKVMEGDDVSVEMIKEHFTKKLLTASANPSFSTSAVSNLVSVYERAAYAEVVEALTMRG